MSVFCADETRAMPKSATLTLPSFRIMMLWGLMSRWMMPRLWACSSALQICVAKCSASRQLSVPFCSIYCLRVMPSMSSMTI